MLRLALVLALLSPQEDDLRGLVRRLGDEDVATRDRAGRVLEQRGKASIEPLTEVLDDPDLELRSRAAVLVDRIDPSYFLASRIVAQRKRNLHRYPGSRLSEESQVSTDGVEFGFERRRWIEGGKTLGTVLRSSVATHFSGEITWSVTSVRSTRELRFDTCSTHSPGVVFVPGDHKEPFTVTLKGVRRWLCDVPIRFHAPKEGDTRRVGRFTVTLQWPDVVLRCDDPLSPSLVTQMLQRHDIQGPAAEAFERPLHEVAQPNDDPVIFFPEAREVEEVSEKVWCGCSTKPSRSELPAATSQKRWVRIAGDDIRGLHEFAEVSLTLHVPVEEPFEVTSPPLEP
ncbi:MAG TPA: hypothetical protein VNM14_17025 [Planctomycetota bacterium]|nr:hypothetical protein [Planctomycetota bacterium]